MPLISIIIPIYKVEKYLDECIRSVLDQTYNDFELILVDDGSPDSSGKICDQFAQHDNRIRVIHKRNEGVTKARKTGYEASLGKWICFVDGDDTLPQNSLEILINNVDDCDVVYGDIKPSKTMKYFKSIKYIEKTCDSNQAIADLFAIKMFTGLPCRLYKRELLNEFVWDIDPRIKVAEDFIMLIRIFNQGTKFKMIENCVYFYRIEDSGASKSTSTLTCIWLAFIYKLNSLTVRQFLKHSPRCVYTLVRGLARIAKSKLLR